MARNPELMETLIPPHARNEFNYPVDKVIRDAVARGTLPTPIYKVTHPQKDERDPPV